MKWEPTIGVEVHIELKTNTKMFSPSINQYGKSANSCTNIIDLGYPGTLPTLNQKAVDLALKAALILHCEINEKMHFDRKNYFYPDNPKNFQITQARTPIGHDGYVEIEIDGETKKIEIERIHMEEDTCKSIHRKNATYLDFNRAGVPLIEIVTKPVIKNDIEAVKYLEKLRELMLYADISDCKIEEGSMRCDANVSMKEVGSSILGTKCEIKNIGSIHNVGLSIQKEIIRQKDLLEHGEKVIEETRRFSSEKEETISMRVKETGNDYRYFPEPDIPYLILTKEQIEKAKQMLPMLPDERRKKYIERGLSIQSANKLIQNRSLSDYFNELLPEKIDFVIASNLLLGEISAYLNKNKRIITETKLDKKKFIQLVTNLSKKEINNKNFKDMLLDIMEKDISLEELMKDKVNNTISDSGELTKIIEKIIAENEESVNDFKNGHDRALKYLMGQIMKETKGTANPMEANKILLEELKK